MRFDNTQRESLDRWLRMGTWSKREALMLLCGADPDVEDLPMTPLTCFAHDFDPSDAFDHYEELTRLWQSDGLDASRRPPNFVFDWADSKNIKIPFPTENEKQPAATGPNIRDQSMLQTIAALLSAWPGGRVPSGKDLEKAAQAVGVAVSDDTIRKVLERAREIAPSIRPPN